jgi:hypothetical protein
VLEGKEGKIMFTHTDVAPRPLDRLWLRLRPKALSLVKRLSRAPAANVARPRATSEDMQRLHKHFEKEGT